MSDEILFSEDTNDEIVLQGKIINCLWRALGACCKRVST